ncbi:MAG: M20/M25/M40 family metallo-hydrolase [Proteobacteria bacterium]|nr:M20/M25/M40 family metallo-hydrolase [Pseudomonadota bacterium]
MRLLPLALLVACGPAATAPEVGVSTSAFEAHLTELASDAYLGRGTGEEGTRLAADYAARTFKGLGLKPRGGDDDYFAPVSFWATDWDASTAVQVGDDTLELGKDFKPFPFSDEGEVEAEVVFAGYGIQAPEFEWDDYAGLDVKGKIVVLLRHEPRENDSEWKSFDGDVTTEHAAFLAKATLAAELGAVGMILATDPLHHESGDDFRGRQRLRLDKPESVDRGPSEGPQFLAVHASRTAVAKMLESSGKSLVELQEAVDAGTAPAELAAQGVRASIAIKASGEPIEVQDRNVVAILPGSNPEKADEIIVIGAHYDHLGAFEGEGDTIYNGADDNASGTSGVLELARVLAEDPPERTVAFALFTGEEKGLLGSKAFVRDAHVDIDKVVFMLNLDMISRNGDKPVDILGEAYATGLESIVRESAEEADLDVRFLGTEYAGNSDHDSFYAVNVPFMFFFTGLHDDYHQLSDHADKVDVGRATSLLKAAHGVVRRISAADKAPGFVHHLTWMGVSVKQSPDGAVLGNVDADGRAAASGLEKGDVLHAVDGTALGADEAGGILADVEPGTTLMLDVKRGVEVRSFELTRAKTGYLGVFPGGIEDEVRKKHGLGDDQGFELRQVMEGGPAASGGLQAGDIVISVAGMPVGLRTLSARLARIGAGEDISVGVIRDGERLSLQVALGERPER